MHSCAIAPSGNEVSGYDNDARLGFLQYGKYAPFTESVAGHMQIGQMRDDEAIKFGRQSFEPGLVPCDFNPDRFEKRGIGDEHQGEAEKKDGDKAAWPPELHGHERSNRLICSSSARVNGIG